MATLTIRNIDERAKTQLRIHAARHGRSMEEEARTIRRTAIEALQPVAGGKVGFPRFFGQSLRPSSRTSYGLFEPVLRTRWG